MSEQISVAQSEALLEAINQHIFLVKLHISWPKLQYQIADAVVEVSDDNGNKIEIDTEYRNNPHWQLMPPMWSSRFAGIESKARSCLTKASIGFGTGGLATIAVRRADTIFQQLRQYRETMYNYRDEFVAAYAVLLTDLQRDLRDRMTQELANKAISKLPTLAQITGKFDMTWAIMPIGNSGINKTQLEQLQNIKTKLHELADNASISPDRDTVVELIAELGDVIRDTLATPRRLADSEASEFITEARRQMAEFTAEFVRNVSRGPRQQLADALEHMLAATRAGKHIQTGSLQSVKRACQMIRDFSFMQDSELLDLLDAVERETDNTTASQFNSDAAIAAQYTEAVTPVLNACNNVDRALNNERQFKRLVLRKRQNQVPVS